MSDPAVAVPPASHPERGCPRPTHRATRGPARSARTALFGAVTFLAVISCGRDGTADSRPGSDPQPQPDDRPLTGGACSYGPLSFTVIVDSVLPGGDVILHPVDSIPSVAGFCPFRDQGNGRWRASQSIVRNLEPGDTAVAEGQVLEMGTCAPCSIMVRPVRER